MTALRPAGSILRWAALLGIATVATMRVLTFFAPQIVFDVDPLLDPLPLGGLGPAGSLWLDVALLLACGLGLLGEALAGRRFDGVLLLLALAPLPVVLGHGWTDAGDLWRGVTWAAAALAGATLAHLARERRVRLVAVALLAAALGPLLVRGAANVTYEHNRTVALFEQQEEQLLADKGWARGSSNALIFERRLRQRQPTAWFLSTNIFGTFAAAGVILGVGLALSSWRAGRERGWAGAMLLLAGVSGAGLWMTASKGAILATLGGLVLVAAPWGRNPIAGLLRRHGPALAVLALLAPLVAVMVRGAILPEGFAGEKSLLFRWHYTVSASRVIADAPLVGVGPDGFQAAYMRHRVERNPEEVASAHAAVWDWLASLGLAGAAWIALVAVLLWRAGGALRPGMHDGDREADPAARAPDTITIAGRCAFVVVVAGLIPALVFELPTLVDALAVTVRGIGIAAYPALAMLLAAVLLGADGPGTRWTLLATIVVLVAHGQVEMTFTQPGSAVWVMCVLGVAGTAREGRRTWPGILSTSIAGAAAAWVMITGAAPALRQERLMIAAARSFVPLTAPNAGPGEIADARLAAAETLRAAHEAMPTARWPLLAAADQRERAARLLPTYERSAPLEAALLDLGDGIDRGGAGRAVVAAIHIHRDLADLTGDDAHVRTAIDLARRMTEADPNGLLTWKRYADLLWWSGDRGEAIEAYKRVLVIDGDFSLDPLKQLPESAREEIERRVADR